MQRETYTHVQSDRNEHGLVYEDEERASENIPQAMKLCAHFSLQWSPVATVSCFLAKLSGASNEQHRP